jgi:putative aminopeptidase FrvX
MKNLDKTSIINSTSMKFLEDYLNNPAPSGDESNGQKIWLNYIGKYIDEHFVDNYGTVVGIINPKSKFKVVIEAHADEISWQVKYITDDGFIHVCKNGDIDHQIAPSKRVNIFTDKGIVKGVFGWPSISIREKLNKPFPKTENLSIDIGATSKSQVESLGIHVGCLITYEDQFEILNFGNWIGRSLDNKIGGFINNVKLPFSLFIVNSVQEEVGLNGASMIVENIEPDLAICIDVTHDTNTPFIKKEIHGDVKCGEGAVINFAPSIHKVIRDLVIDNAKKNNIPYQFEATSNVTDTDADAFAYGCCGVPTCLISIPLRYMHTTVEMVNKGDVESCIQLIYETLLSINTKLDLKYLK